MSDQIKYEKDLDILDLWESPNGNLFLKVNDNFSVALGQKGFFGPIEHYEKGATFVLSDTVTPVKKVGKLIFD